MADEPVRPQGIPPSIFFDWCAKDADQEAHSADARAENLEQLAAVEVPYVAVRLRDAARLTRNLASTQRDIRSAFYAAALAARTEPPVDPDAQAKLDAATPARDRPS